MLHQMFHPPERPKLTSEQHVERLNQELASYRRTLVDLHSRLDEARSRLGLISQIADDSDRCRRSPGTSWAAVRAALYARPDKLGGVRRDLPTL